MTLDTSSDAGWHFWIDRGGTFTDVVARRPDGCLTTDSGGLGRHRGGKGTVRRVRFREPMTAAVLSSHRKVAPFGLSGGESGALGYNWIERSDGTREELAGTDQAEMGVGDVFVIEAPGGAGFGPATAR